MAMDYAIFVESLFLNVLDDLNFCFSSSANSPP